MDLRPNEQIVLDVLDTSASVVEQGEVAMAMVLGHLKHLRIGVAGLEEAALRDSVQARLESVGLPFQKEFIFAPRCRADLWLDGLVIELKKQRPARADVLNQLTRYARSGVVRGIILVLERHVPIPAEVEGVPCAVVSLNSQWGITI